MGCSTGSGERWKHATAQVGRVAPVPGHPPVCLMCSSHPSLLPACPPDTAPSAASTQPCTHLPQHRHTPGGWSTACRSPPVGPAQHPSGLPPARRDNPDIVQQLVAAGADVHTGSPLVSTARSGAAAAVQLLLAAGADANSAWSGVPVLYWAAFKGHSAVVQQLLAAGAEVDWTCPRNGMTALMTAAEHCHETVVELLLAAGAAVNQKDTSGNSALCLASLKGDRSLGIMQRVLQADADDAGRALQLHHYSPSPSEAVFDLLLPAASACDALRAVAQAAALERLPALLAARLPLTHDDWDNSLIWQCPDLRPTLAVILQRPDWRDHVSHVTRLLPAPHLAFLRTTLLCMHRPQPSVSSGKVVHVSLPHDIILCVLMQALA